jgi:hypothetical protein
MYISFGREGEAPAEPHTDHDRDRRGDPQRLGGSLALPFNFKMLVLLAAVARRGGRLHAVIDRRRATDGLHRHIATSRRARADHVRVAATAARFAAIGLAARRFAGWFRSGTGRFAAGRFAATVGAAIASAPEPTPDAGAVAARADPRIGRPAGAAAVAGPIAEAIARFRTRRIVAVGTPVFFAATAAAELAAAATGLQRAQNQQPTSESDVTHGQLPPKYFANVADRLTARTDAPCSATALSG